MTVDALITPSRGLLRSTWSILHGHRLVAVMLAALAVIIAQAETAALVLIALMAEAATTGAQDVSTEIASLRITLALEQATLISVLFILAAASLTLIWGAIGASKVSQVEAEAREFVAANLAKADWEFQSREKISRVEGRMRLAESPGMVFSGFLEYVRAGSAVLIFVIVASAISPLAAGLMIVMGAVFSMAVLPLRSLARKLAAKSARQKVGMTDELIDAMEQGASAHSFDAWPGFLDSFMSRSQRLARTRRQEFLTQTRLPVVYQYGALLILVLALFLAPRPDGQSSLAAFAASALLLLRSVQYGQTVQRALHKLAMHIPLVQKLRDDSLAVEPRLKPGDKQLSQVETIELVGASYAYPDADLPAIRGVSFAVQTGSIVGIAGHSGGGKSTLGQVLLRLRWPTEGNYLVNGQDANVYSRESWTSAVGYLPQSPRLLHATLLENVRYFNDAVSEKAVTEALEAVGLREFVSQLPDGVHTLIGSTGHALSGGQVQRLGIARVLARQPSMVVLDEPTSALDADSESIVSTALESLARRSGMIIVIIAHRASTLLLCDRIVLLSDGCVVDTGRPAELRKRNSLVARILREGVEKSPLTSVAERL